MNSPTKFKFVKFKLNLRDRKYRSRTGLDLMSPKKRSPLLFLSMKKEIIKETVVGWVGG
jgi:hypothetical protein